MAEAQKAVFDSFLHSQGNPVLQSELLHHLDDAGVVDYVDAVDLIAGCADALMNHTATPMHGARVSNPQESFDLTLETLRERQHVRPLGIPKMRDLVVAVDWKALCRLHSNDGSGRARRPVYAGHFSPSHFFLFGVENVPTGLEVYDELYEDVIAAKVSLWGGRSVRNSIGKLASLHVRNNPQSNEVVSGFMGYDVAQSHKSVQIEHLIRVDYEAAMV